METRIVRINGQPLRVIRDELPDPHPDGYPDPDSTDPESDNTCRALEPDWPDNSGGVAVCTMPQHDTSAKTGTAHIAHGGDDQVIAIWGPPAVVSAEDSYA